MTSHGQPDPNCRACMRASFVAEGPAPCAEHAAVPTLSWLRGSVLQPKPAPEPTVAEPLDERRAAAAAESEATRVAQMTHCTRCRELRADDPDAVCPEHVYKPYAEKSWHPLPLDDVMSAEEFNALIMSI